MKTLDVALSILFFVTSAVDLSALENRQANGASTEVKTTHGNTGKSDNISSLIKALDHDDFKKREAAGKELRELGKVAIPALAELVNRKSPEASVRAFNIIAHHYRNGDDGERETAAGVLQEIMESGKHFAVRAKQVMEDQKPLPRVAKGLNLQVAGKAGASTRVAISIKNGVRKVDAEEGGRHVKILDDPQKGITLEVIEEKEGKKEMKKYEARNVGELKAKHPEAHRLYQEYVGNVHGNGGNIRIQLKTDAP